MLEGSPKEATQKEKEKARKLRKTQWWFNKLNTGLCHYCGEKFSRGQLTMDHVVPLSRGGKSTKGNVVPACKECNNKKTTDIPVETLLKNNGMY
tara:strand:+ start:2943 stop:3224 length:282 start_codon:yes stop_codon:yes gene_type:complete